jgi:DNA modification methylase
MIVNANALQLPMADNSVQCVVTSPPYWGLRDYGTAKWDGGDPECDHKENDRRNNRPHGISDTFHGGDDSNQIHPYKNICGKCGAVRSDSQLGLEPTPEEYVANMVAVFREVWRVLRDDGTCWLNLGDSYASQGGPEPTQSINPDRVGGSDTLSGGKSRIVSSGLKPKDLIGIPWRVAFALQADGWWLRSDIIWHKPNPMPESVTDRPTKAHEYLFLLTKSARYYFDQDAVREAATTQEDRPSGIVRDRVYGYDSKQAALGRFRGGAETPEPTSRNIRTVWTIATQPTPYAHFATFPEKLVEPCIKAGSKQGDIVFDPFMGSGTVERVAIRLRRHAIGTELNYKYIREIASIRTSNIQPVMLEAQP